MSAYYWLSICLLKVVLCTLKLTYRWGEFKNDTFKLNRKFHKLNCFFFLKKKDLSVVL